MEGGKPVVLIVEDYPDQAELFAIWLRDQYTVRMATSGEEALGQLDDDVRVVLLDRLLSGIGGDEVLDQIRERGHSCQVALVTSLEPEFDYPDMGFDEYLLKPIRKNELVGTVERLLARDEAHAVDGQLADVQMAESQGSDD